MSSELKARGLCFFFFKKKETSFSYLTELNDENLHPQTKNKQFPAK